MHPIPQAAPAPPRAPRAAWRLRIVGFVDALGTGLFLPLAVIYLTRVVGLSASQIGLGLGASGAVGVAAAPLAGALLDRHDARVVVVGCFAASAAGYLGYMTVRSFSAFLLVALVAQSASRMDRPAVAALVVAACPPEERILALAWQQTMRNCGYGIGGLLAGVALLAHGHTGFDVVLAANAASYLLAAGLVCTLDGVSPIATETNGGLGHVLRDATYMRLALLNVAGGLHDSMLRVAMPLWLITRTAAPAALAGPLFALNTILVVSFQIRVSRSASTRKGLHRAYRTTALAFLGSGVGFLLASSFSAVGATALLTTGLIGLTIAEQHNTAAEAVVSINLAPEEMRSRYLSVFKTSIAVQQATGPALVTVALVSLGRTGWVLITAIAAIASLISGTLTENEPRLTLLQAPTAGIRSHSSTRSQPHSPSRASIADASRSTRSPAEQRRAH